MSRRIVQHCLHTPAKDLMASTKESYIAHLPIRCDIFHDDDDVVVVAAAADDDDGGGDNNDGDQTYAKSGNYSM